MSLVYRDWTWLTETVWCGGGCLRLWQHNPICFLRLYSCFIRIWTKTVSSWFYTTFPDLESWGEDLRSSMKSQTVTKPITWLWGLHVNTHFWRWWFICIFFIVILCITDLTAKDCTTLLCNHYESSSPSGYFSFFWCPKPQDTECAIF